MKEERKSSTTIFFIQANQGNVESEPAIIKLAKPFYNILMMLCLCPHLRGLT